jgi:hypothetical protein
VRLLKNLREALEELDVVVDVDPTERLGQHGRECVEAIRDGGVVDAVVREVHGGRDCGGVLLVIIPRRGDALQQVTVVTKLVHSLHHSSRRWRKGDTGARGSRARGAPRVYVQLHLQVREEGCSWRWGVARAGKSEAKFVYLLGADDLTPADIPEDAFVVYQGHHGDRSTYRANVILPGAAYTEKEGTYENVEGRAQQTSPAVPTVGDARDDWKIIRTLSEVAGKTLPYDNANGLRARMLAEALNLLRVDEVELATGWSLDMNMRPTTALEYSALPKAIENYYMADVANLIKLVDTRDIVELELQQSGRADS